MGAETEAEAEAGRPGGGRRGRGGVRGGQVGPRLWVCVSLSSSNKLSDRLPTDPPSASTGFTTTGPFALPVNPCCLLLMILPRCSTSRVSWLWEGWCSFMLCPEEPRCRYLYLSACSSTHRTYGTGAGLVQCIPCFIYCFMYESPSGRAFTCCHYVSDSGLMPSHMHCILVFTGSCPPLS